MMRGDCTMIKIVELFTNAMESFKRNMDQYGKAKIIVSNGIVNNNILAKL
jgi:hypothetical protein